MEDHRIEPLVGDAVVDDLHLFQTGNGLEIDGVIQHEQVAALHERDAHAPGEKAVFGIHRAAGAGGKQHHGRVGIVGKRAEQFENVHRRLRNGVNGKILETLWDHPGQSAPVLDHVGNARRVAEVVMFHREVAIGQAADGQAAQVQISATGRREARGGTLIAGAAENGLDRQFAGAEDFLWAVDVAQKHLKGSQALANAFLRGAPILRA